jgi:O-antigen/teichoic acid export membrane protein
MGKIARNYIYNILYQLLVLVAPILTAPYLARVLGAELLGVANYVVTVAGVFTTIGLLGVQNYAIREIAYVRDEPEKLKQTFYEIVWLRLFLGIVTLAIYIPYIWLSSYPDLMLIELMYVIAVFIDPCWFYIGMEDMGKAVARNFFAKAANIIGIFLLVKTQQDYVKYVFLLSFMTLLASLLATPPLRKYIKSGPPKVSLKSLKRHLKGSLQLFWPQVATLVYLSVDKIMLEHFVSSSAVAYYDQAEKIVKIPLTFITVLSTVMMPRLASQFSNGNNDQVKSYLSKTIQFSSMLAYPMMFGVAGVAATLIPWYLGDEFIPVIMAIWVLSPLIMLNSMVGISGDQYLVATKQTHILTMSYVAAAIVNVIIDAVLIPKVGVVGAAVGTIAAYGVSLLVQYRTLLNQLNLKKDIMNATGYLLKAVPMMIVVIAISRVMAATWITTAVQVVVGVAVYGGTLFLLKDPLLYELAEKAQKIIFVKK